MRQPRQLSERTEIAFRSKIASDSQLIQESFRTKTPPLYEFNRQNLIPVGAITIPPSIDAIIADIDESYTKPPTPQEIQEGLFTYLAAIHWIAERELTN